MEKQLILYGATNCHKTAHYQAFLNAKKLVFQFHDVLVNEEKASELRRLYKSGKLNFPTLVVAGKKLRNPSDLELDKRLIKNGFTQGTNYAKNLRFTCGIDSTRHDCGDAVEY